MIVSHLKFIIDTKKAPLFFYSALFSNHLMMTDSTICRIRIFNPSYARLLKLSSRVKIPVPQSNCYIIRLNRRVIKDRI